MNPTKRKRKWNEKRLSKCTISEGNQRGPKEKTKTKTNTKHDDDDVNFQEDNDETTEAFSVF